MKLLVFTTLFPNKQMPHHGVFVKERILNLSKLCDIRVIAPVPYFPRLKLNKKWHAFSQIPKEEEVGGLKVYHPRYLVTPKIFRPLYGFFMFLGTIGLIKMLKKEFDFDMIDAHFIYPDGFAAILLGKAINKKVILNGRGSDINVYPDSRIIRQLIKYALKNASYVTTVSDNLKKKIVDLGVRDRKIKVVNNGVDMNRFYISSRSDARKELGLPQDKKILLSIGNLIKGKGFQLLIKAVDLLKREDVILFIIGDGAYRSALEDMIKRLGLAGRIKLLGARPQEELRKWYCAADLFCLASLREGRPNVAVEALACGTPVISMHNIGLDDLITPDNGILVGSYEPTAIKDAIGKALGQNWDKERTAATVRHLSWDKCTAEMRDIFKKTLNQKDILFFSSDDWDSGLKTSKYHLSIRLAGANKVLFIESIGLRNPKAGKRDFNKVLNKLRKWSKGIREVQDNLFVYTPLALPWHSKKIVALINSFLLKTQIFIISKMVGMKDPIYWTFLPNTYNLVKAHHTKVVYYCVDNMPAFEGVDHKGIKALDDKLAKAAGVVFAVSKPIYDDKKSLNGNTYYMPHGVNFEHFANGSKSRPEALKDIPGPIIGFYGLISGDWVDFKLISTIARAHPEWSVVMIGKIDANPEELPHEKNIHYLGPVAYGDLPPYGRCFDVAMIPFSINQVTLYSNPLKLYEYFAMGKPVVSVDLPEIRHLDGMVRIAKDHQQFVTHVEACLASDDTVNAASRVEFARNNSWDKKVEEILNIVERHCVR